ncbi:MAG: transposase [Acidimicrobiales bacterium]
MARGIRQTYPGARHHVFNRASARRTMFLDDRDRRMFLALLKEVHERFDVSCHAFCLMGNHYHLVLHTPDGNLSDAMRHHASGYTRSFNRRHGRDGPLFRGRFRSTVVENDAHLLQLVRYVHRNPDDLRPEVDRDDYRWSSQGVYLGRGRQPPWLETTLVLAIAGGPASYRAFVAEPQPSDGPMTSEEAIPLNSRQIDPPSGYVVVAAVEQAIAAIVHHDPQTEGGYGSLARRLCAVALAAELGASSHDIATSLGFTNTSSVRSAVHRSRRKATTDPAYAALVEQVRDLAEQQLRATKGA